MKGSKRIISLRALNILGLGLALTGAHIVRVSPRTLTRE